MSGREYERWSRMESGAVGRKVEDEDKDEETGALQDC